MVWSRDQKSGFDSLLPKKWRGDSAGPLSDVFRTARDETQPGDPRNAFKSRRKLDDLDLTAPLSPVLKTKPDPDSQKPDSAAKDKDKDKDKPKDNKSADKAPDILQAAAPTASQTHAKPQEHIKPKFMDKATYVAVAPRATASADQKATEPANYDLALTRFRTQEFGVRQQARQKEQHTPGNHDEKREKDEQFERLLEAMENQKEQDEHRFQEYIDDMIEYTSNRRRELDEEERLTREELAELEQRQNLIIRQLGILDEQHVQAIERLAQSDRRIQEYRTAIDQKREDIVRTREDIDRTDNERRECDRRRQRLQEQREQTGRDRRDADNRLSSATGNADVENETRRQLRRAHDLAARELETKQQELEKARINPLKDNQGRTVLRDENQIFYTRDETGNRVEYTEDELRDLKRRNETEGQRTPDEIARMETEARELEERKNKMAEEMRRAQEQEERARREAEEAQNTITALDAREAELDKEIDKNSKDAEALKARSQALRTELIQKETELNKLNQQLNDERNNKAEIEEKIRQINTEIAARKLEQRDVARDYQQKRQYLETLKIDKETLDAIENKQREMKNISPAARAKAQQEINELKDKLSPKERDLFNKNEQERRAKAGLDNKPEDTVTASGTKREAATSTLTTGNNTSPQASTLAVDQTSRAKGSAAPAESIKAAANLSQFNPAAVGLPLTGVVATPEQENIFVATRVAAAPATGGVRPS